MIAHREWPCQALGRRQPFTVSVPEGPPPAGGWPLLLLLHGAGRHHRTVVEDPRTREDVARTPAVVAMPDGGLGFWIDSPVRPESRYRSMLDELLALLRAELPVSPAAARTGICGWSMGGFGAVAYAEHRPEAVAAVASCIGLLDFPQPELPAIANYPVPEVFGTDPAVWEAHNCRAGAERLRGRRIAVFTARQAFDHQMNLRFHRHLEALAIAHRFDECEGRHEWPVVAATVPRMLAFLVEATESRNAE